MRSCPKLAKIALIYYMKKHLSFIKSTFPYSHKTSILPIPFFYNTVNGKMINSYGTYSTPRNGTQLFVNVVAVF